MSTPCSTGSPLKNFTKVFGACRIPCFASLDTGSAVLWGLQGPFAVLERALQSIVACKVPCFASLETGSVASLGTCFGCTELVKQLRSSCLLVLLATKVQIRSSCLLVLLATKVPFFDSMEVWQQWRCGASQKIPGSLVKAADGVCSVGLCGLLPQKSLLNSSDSQPRFLSSIPWMNNLEAMGRAWSSRYEVLPCSFCVATKVPFFDSVDDVWQSWRCGASKASVFNSWMNNVEAMGRAWSSK